MAVDVRGRLPTEMAGERVVLRRYAWSDAPILASVLAAEQSRLSRWLPWALVPPTERSVHDFLGGAIERFGQERADYAITRVDAPDRPYVGGCGLSDRIGPGGLEIGYWLVGAHTGCGLATEAAGLLTSAALALDGIDRVEIHCDQANLRSAAVPARLGYLLDRIEDDEVRTSAESGHSMIWVCDALACQGASHG
jgi:RimJ/RimL family protein N-acetyltransferase